MNNLRYKTRKEGERVDYIVLAVSILVSLALNFVFMILAASIALKTYTRILAQIIDTCASEDKDKMFTEKWCAKHR